MRAPMATGCVVDQSAARVPSLSTTRPVMAMSVPRYGKATTPALKFRGGGPKGGAANASRGAFPAIFSVRLHRSPRTKTICPWVRHLLPPLKRWLPGGSGRLVAGLCACHPHAWHLLVAREPGETCYTVQLSDVQCCLCQPVGMRAEKRGSQAPKLLHQSGKG
ncbi:MAG: hypothetical protein JWR80_4860 [Bradyrhizobium sp.]|nr:hypothetical protein [Bradyrhizobium sp.]